MGSTGVNPAGDTSPQYFGWGDVNGNIPPILLRTFGYSRPILVALRSLSLNPIRCPIPSTPSACWPILLRMLQLWIKKCFIFSTSEFTKICHFEIIKQNIFGEGHCPLPRTFPPNHRRGWGVHLPHPTPFDGSSLQH